MPEPNDSDPLRGAPAPISGVAAAAPGFVATRWTLVLRARGASPESQLALSELCEAYYAPVQAFIRATVRPADSDTARDLTQEFFARVLRGGTFDRVVPERGRFRSFLLGAVKHFLADARDRERAAKRGGDSILLALEAGTDTSPGLDVPDPRWSAVQAAFDRQWAMTLLDRALRRLGAEMAADGKGAQFEVLKAWLTAGASPPQAEAAARLGLNEGAVKVAIHRLRTRFRDLVKGEIAQTVDHPSEIPSELNYLIEVVSRSPSA